MATATPIQSSPPQTGPRTHLNPETTHSPLVLWHLLSLDAPTIAALWTWFIARVNYIHLPTSSILAMAVAVWMLYAADRLMDARLMDIHLVQLQVNPAEDLEARHYFHHNHRTALRGSAAYRRRNIGRKMLGFATSPTIISAK